MNPQKQSPPPEPSSVQPQPTFRSAAVARMARMPVSTLRIWEQRNQAVGPTTAPSGHRLYSATDVQRIVMLRQLTERGHAIGSLVGLDIEQLEAVALTHDQHTAQPKAELRQSSVSMRVVVVGQAMARRLQRHAVTHKLARPLQVMGVFDSLDEAVQAAKGATRVNSANDSNAVTIDVLLWQSSGLQDNALHALKAAQNAWRARGVAVAYRFASSAARDALMSAGFFVAREPADDEALGAWLTTLEAALFVDADANDQDYAASSAKVRPWSADWQDMAQDMTLNMTKSAVPARLFDDATLTEFANLPSTIACECPSHLAELLIQISSFETYSADCIDRNHVDAQLHAYLHQVAGTARTLFETALKRVAVAEGLVLPHGRT